jgi:hypothetical protein
VPLVGPFLRFEPFEIALETTSDYEFCYDLLKSPGHHAAMAHPLKTRIIAVAKVKKDGRTSSMCERRRNVHQSLRSKRLIYSSFILLNLSLLSSMVCPNLFENLWLVGK